MSHIRAWTNAHFTGGAHPARTSYVSSVWGYFEFAYNFGFSLHGLKADNNNLYLSQQSALTQAVHTAETVGFQGHVAPSVPLVQVCEGMCSWSVSLTQMTASPLTLIRHWAYKEKWTRKIKILAQ